MRLPAPLLALALMIGLIAAPRAAALDDAHWEIANTSIDAGIAYLLETQNEDGSWIPDPGPAVTGLVLTALLQHPEIDAQHPAAAKAIEYILAHVQEDGSIRNGPDGILANYNTALCLSALAKVYNNPDATAAIAKGQEYLRGTQWIVGMTDPNGDTITEDHPYVGGFGYGKHGRPDLSNTQLALQAMYDTGCDCEDPAFQRALVFLNRTQAIESNDLYADVIGMDEGNHGGFIYAPSLNQEHQNTPESKADPEQMDEAANGATVSNLRTYGGMTYSGFKTLLYANLERDDPRVQAVLGWIAHNYEFDHNPGMPEAVKLQGLYYYYLSMARALDAWGSSSVSVFEGQPGETVSHDWANDLIDKLASMQAEDGSWVNTASRWMEDSPILCTAYAVQALQAATD
ncbi:MAG: prenyltransferase/squalene oxidase repeat-containing protein [Phycisphaerales bacterium JB063]